MTNIVFGGIIRNRMTTEFTQKEYKPKYEMFYFENNEMKREIRLLEEKIRSLKNELLLKNAIIRGLQMQLAPQKSFLPNELGRKIRFIVKGEKS